MFGRKKRRLSDIDSEIKSHLDLATEQFHEQGLDEREARYAALRQFGNVTIARERLYEARRWRWLDDLGSELRHALKNLIQTPRFTLPAVLTLALGLGGAMTFYSAFHSVFLRALPFPGADRIYRLVTNTPTGPNPWPTVGLTMELGKLSPDVERVGLLEGLIQSYWILDDGSSVPVQALSFDAGIQDMAGLKPAFGSLFQDDAFATGNGVILSHRFWKSRLGSDPTVVGRTLNIQNIRRPILGVLSEGAEVPLSPEADVYLPIKTLTSQQEIDGTTCTALLRLRSGIRPEAVLSRFLAAAQNLSQRSGFQEHPDLQSLRKAMAADADLRFFVVCGAAALFLLLATANVACLFLARAAERAWETSVRLCLGAPALSLFRKFLAEGLVVALVSAGFGFWLNMALAGSLRAWLPGGESLPGLNGTWDHLGVASFGLGLVILITLLLGLIPMLQIRRLDLSLAIQEGHRIQGVRTKGRTALVVVQMTLATLMLCATALLGRSLWAMSHRPLGFKAEKLAMVRLLYDHRPKLGQRWENPAFLPALRARSGIQSAALTNGFGGVSGMSLLSVSGRAAHIGDDGHELGHFPLLVVSLSPQALETLGVSLIQGRDFTAEDAQNRVCILNREAERLAGLASGKAAGQKLYLGKVPMEIIGVTPDVHLFQDDGSAAPMLFQLLNTFPPDALFVRSTLSKKDLEATISSVMRETFPGVKPGSVDELSEMRGEQSLPHRQIIAMLAVFGGTAILLAALGLSALLSDSVSRRRRELGIRATLGATSKRLIGQVMLQGLWRTGLGVGLGLAAALASGRYLKNLLFGIRANDPKTLAAVASLLLFLGLVSSLIPALRAASIDPAKALREE
ncbi:MAG: ABC transporter permease [Acidobacteriia bacterium]|nr:ABC transporter permease [Terriglobia bacterium]